MFCLYMYLSGLQLRQFTFHMILQSIQNIYGNIVLFYIFMELFFFLFIVQSFLYTEVH
jgi:hypothetical protein